MSTATAYGYTVASPVSAPTIAVGSGAGAMGTSGSYSYQVTYLTPYGETTASSASSSLTTGSGSMLISNIPISPSGNVTGRALYRTAVGGSTYLRLAVIPDNQDTTYTDVIADSALGAAVPTFNTAHSREIMAGYCEFQLPIVKASISSEVAAGTNLATSTGLSGMFPVHFVSGATGTNGVALPQINSNLTDVEWTVKNTNATNALLVYSFNSSDTINGAAPPYSLAAATSKVFHATSATSYQVL